MMRLSEAAKALGAELIGEDVVFTSVGTDSRHIVTGQLFVALKGEHFDGHAYAQQALEQGAAAVLVSSSDGAMPALLVKDTRLALGQLAQYWRQRFTGPLVAVTGSNGKTTVKEMLSSILKAASSDEAVLATQGNFNNDIGMPLTLLRLTAKEQFAVIEMGMNHLGEIDYLSHLAQPNVALINNAGLAHIGELGSVEAIAQAKGEIFSGLQANGTAIINADDKFADYWRSLVPHHRVMTFGLSKPADVTASYVLQEDGASVQLTTSKGEVQIALPMPGLHNVSNALAAATAALAVGATLTHIKQGLENFAGVKGRLQKKTGLNGALVIDDTYNANPLSMKAAMDVLAAQSGTKIMVMGDMGELGTEAAAMHIEMGQYAKQLGFEAFYTLGELSEQAAHAYGAGAVHFASPEQIAQTIAPQLSPSAKVLVKGSRFMRMERVVELITANASALHQHQETTTSEEKH